MFRFVDCAAMLMVMSSAASLGAQQPGIAGPSQSRLLAVAVRSDTIPHQAVVSNWQEPALIGGGLLGGLGGLFGYAFCAGPFFESEGSACPLRGEIAFLASGAFGGLIAGLIGSTSKPRSAPDGYEIHGDRRLYGALLLAVPSFAFEAYGFGYECRHHDSYRAQGCTPGNALMGIVSVAFNAWLGSRIGKAIPAFRPK